MRRITLSLLATTAVFGLTAGAATAADLPRKAPAPIVAPPPPLWNWTGFYVGGFGGAGWARNDVTNTSVIVDGFQFFPQNGGDRTFGNGVGALGGITLGYNWQFANSPIVIGIEGEWAWADLQGDAARNRTTTSGDSFFVGKPTTALVTLFGTNNASIRSNFQVRDIATITGRFGLASGPQDRTLWYVKGGGAWVKNNVTVNAQANSFNCESVSTLTVPNTSVTACSSDSGAASFNGNFNKWGWTVGTGLEFGLWDKWSGKVEWDYVNVGSRTFNAVGRDSFGDAVSASAQLKQNINVVKIGLNYRFGAWGWGKSPAY
jgi:outer membrane immunogenic protein